MIQRLAVLVLVAFAAGCSSSSSASSVDGGASDADQGGCTRDASPGEMCMVGSLGCADDQLANPTCVDGAWVCKQGVPLSSCGACVGQGPTCCIGQTSAGSATCDRASDAGWTCADGGTVSKSGTCP